MNARRPRRSTSMTAAATAALTLAAMGAQAQSGSSSAAQLRGASGASWRLAATDPIPTMRTEWQRVDSTLRLAPRSTLRLGAAGHDVPLDEVVRELRLAPVLTVGTRFSF